MKLRNDKIKFQLKDWNVISHFVVAPHSYINIKDCNMIFEKS